VLLLLQNEMTQNEMTCPPPTGCDVANKKLPQINLSFSCLKSLVAWSGVGMPKNASDADRPLSDALRAD
jgi:hypothetical protein